MNPDELLKYTGKKITFRLLGGEFTYRGEVLESGRVAIRSRGQIFEVGPKMISEVVS
jgi:hypothetical protein